jgi:hypothetical protein
MRNQMTDSLQKCDYFFDISGVGFKSANKLQDILHIFSNRRLKYLAFAEKPRTSKLNIEANIDADM